MNINIENYEEYFLLYADKELSEDQRGMVEVFVSAHPELKKEFEAILLTIQQPDSVFLHDKSFLLKTEQKGFINAENFEEKFVEYHDSELSDAERELTQKFVQENPEAAKDFHGIGRAHLVPDTSILFPDKAKLYRHPARIRTLIVRYTAAAVLAGFAIAWGVNSLKHSDSPIIKTLATQSPSTKEFLQPAAEPAPAATTPADTHLQTETTRHSSGNKEAFDEKERTSLPVQQQDNEKAMNNKPSQPALAGIHDTQIPEQVTALNVATPIPENHFTEMAGAISHTETVVGNYKDNSKELIASLQKDNEPDSYVLDIPVDQINRSKLGIFIKKVKRTIDRNNPINRLFNAE